MPLYIFSHPETGAIKEVMQRMTDSHVYSENGVEWTREFVSPNASVDTKIDAWDSNDFVNKTANKKGTLGSIWDKSAELSEKRKGTSGVDPIREAQYEKYKKQTGKPHINKIKENAAKKLKSLGVSVE